MTNLGWCGVVADDCDNGRCPQLPQTEPVQSAHHCVTSNSSPVRALVCLGGERKAPHFDSSMKAERGRIELTKLFSESEISVTRSAGSAPATSNATAANRKSAEDRPRDQEHRVAERDLHRAPQVLLHHRPRGANASKSQSASGCRARKGVAIFEVDQC